MTDSELIAILQQQNTTLIATVNSLTQELTALKAIILECDASAEKLKRLAYNKLPKKT